MLRACELLGGAPLLRKKLADAVRERRKQLGVSRKALDNVCMFGGGLPTSAEFEADPSLMTSKVFGLASVALDLAVDEVLKEDLKRALTPEVAGRLASELDPRRQDRQAGLAAGTGGRAVAEVSGDDQVPVYFVLKALKEMDEDRPV